MEPLLGYFKKGLTHIAIVTEIILQDGKDPSRKNIGIVTLEDIIEEIIQDEIDDEQKKYSEGAKVEKKILKEKLITLFQDHETGNELSNQEV